MSADIDNYNADELVAPEWLNEHFFKDVLTHDHNDPNVKVIDFKISPATAKGDHYASIMFRAEIEYSIGDEKLSKPIIIKTMPEQEGHKKEFLGEAKFFPTEIAMYTEVLPKLEAILREAGDETSLCAKCIYHTLEPRQVMVFEDLVPQGYSVVRKRVANLEEIKAAIAKLAKWHAVSFKLLKEDPTVFDKMKYDLTEVPNYLEQDFMKTSLPNLIKSLGKNDKLKGYLKYLEPLTETLLSRWVEIIREYRENRQEDAYYVLCHGDFHLKNMMFKGTECMLLDFQISYVGSMTNDLLYAMYLFYGPEERRDRYDELIYFYFTNLTNTLKTIGYQGKLPSLVEFRKQLFERRHHEIFLMSIFLPGFNCMRKGQDPGELMTDPTKLAQMFDDKDFHEELEYLLPRMLHLGYFEQLE
ncbi:uncharacterized protein LOC132786566 [Drosophila nasuta]|uniref:uncharacterized protein LOC132786566 n=1 Tax=Drosophila nasuta TaxID=42062 RepID=UPI00295F5154|nr:uncharacterized protein LOC132786566 [Drosophila nasuta]